MRIRIVASIDYLLHNRAEEINLSLLQKVQTAYGAHLDSYPKRVEFYIIEDKAVGA
jgi:hypothetical protein